MGHTRPSRRDPDRRSHPCRGLRNHRRDHPTAPGRAPDTPDTPTAPTPPSPPTPPSDPSISTVAPGRVLDSRPGMATVDGQYAGAGLRPAGSVTEVHVIDRGGVPHDASSVVLNVTVTEPQQPGYVTVFPCGTALPNASNLNFIAGETFPNAVIAKVGNNGNVCLYSSADTHLVVDVNGYSRPSENSGSLAPGRCSIVGRVWRPSTDSTPVPVCARPAVSPRCTSSIAQVCPRCLQRRPQCDRHRATTARLRHRVSVRNRIADASNLNFVAGKRSRTRSSPKSATTATSASTARRHPPRRRRQRLQPPLRELRLTGSWPCVG